MEIYLIRHTTPAVERGICYGFADIDVAPTFETEAARVKGLLPDKPMDVYASPLQRCSKLATYLFGHTFTTDERLKELNFGDWEMQRWDDLGLMPCKSGWKISCMCGYPTGKATRICTTAR